ncbi:MAG: ribbon-helix-helix protein, CopG family, partial [Verrucomicrobia bacterium]|nr:ribbon-helix-helix protein, CopG family [Verrucomicrobiota bacterium]
MIRTQIQLEEAQFDLIRSEAAKKNISVAGFVREALARYLKSPRQVALRNLATLRPA